MKIIIAGAGDIGFHLAKLLSHEKHAITLIDQKQETLDNANSQLDVFTIKGDSSSLDILQQAGAEECKLFLAVTTSEKNNLMSAILAKKMGAKQTIARVNSDEYLCAEYREMFKDLGIDKLISPQKLAAIEIQRLVKENELTDVFHFENGQISAIGITVDDDSKLVNLSLQEIGKQYEKYSLRVVAILRGDHTIIPRGSTTIKRGDHVYILTNHANISYIASILGKARQEIKNIMILGGKKLGYITTKILQDDYNLTVVESCKDTCKFLTERLDNALVIQADPSNVQILKEEGLERMDAVIALMANTESNIIACLMADKLGVNKTIALVDNSDYIHISQNIGVDTLINKKLIAANNIFRYVRKGNVKAIAGLHGVDAEVIEFVIKKNNRITKHPLRDLHFPKQALIGGVIRGDESFVPNGDLQLAKGDKVIVFTKNEAIYRVENFFR
ncbi:MAG: trk system potassium uptake protein TrkA [Cognaticolwellia sp.]|jgi:trk system potassium uptake protein TrkA